MPAEASNRKIRELFRALGRMERTGLSERSLRAWRMRYGKRAVLVLVAAGLALGMAACGDDDDSPR